MDDRIHKKLHHRPRFEFVGLNTWALNFLRKHEATKNGEVRYYRDSGGMSHRLHTYHTPDGAKFIEVVEWIHKEKPRLIFTCLKLVGLRRYVKVEDSRWRGLELDAAIRQRSHPHHPHREA